MKKSSKVIFFDNGCRVCRTGALLAGKSGIASQAELTELQEMNEEVSCDLDKARYCNEIAVYDVLTKESRYGIKGMIWFLEDKWGKWINVFLLPPIYQILISFYHIFSYNRKMIAPVYEKVENDCEPEFHWGYRLGYIGIVILINVLLGRDYLLVFVVPNILMLIVGLIWVPRNIKMEFVGHLSTMMLIQIPLFILMLSLLNFLPVSEYAFWIWPFLVFYGCFYLYIINYLFNKRLEYLGLNYLRHVFPFLSLMYFILVSFLFSKI